VQRKQDFLNFQVEVCHSALDADNERLVYVPNSSEQIRSGAVPQQFDINWAKYKKCTDDAIAFFASRQTVVDQFRNQACVEAMGAQQRLRRANGPRSRARRARDVARH
jgi:hypothetical protein